MKNLLNNINNVVNNHSFGLNVDADLLKRQVIEVIKTETNLGNSIIVNRGEFTCNRYGEIPNSILGKLKYNVYITFKVSSKRSDKISGVNLDLHKSKVKYKYLSYIDKNPVKFKELKINIESPAFEFRSDGKIVKSNCSYVDKVAILNKMIDLKEVDTVVQNIVNSKEVDIKIKEHICSPLINKAFCNSDYANSINFNQFINNKSCNIDKIYRYIMNQNMLII